MIMVSSDQRHMAGVFQPMLQPKHVLVAAPLRVKWKIPAKFWQILRVICWQVWKARKEHYMANRTTDHRQTIPKSWHRFSMYLRKEWKHLTRKIHRGRISLAKAELRMQSLFGNNLEIWHLQGLLIQVPPVPPRPP